MSSDRARPYSSGYRGSAPITYLDYDCDEPGCAGSLRIYVTATGEARVGHPRAALGPKPGS